MMSDMTSTGMKDGTNAWWWTEYALRHRRVLSSLAPKGAHYGYMAYYCWDAVSTLLIIIAFLSYS